ncbi:MAG: aldo/keto reductase [Clostridia bacterium]|nr:aldo/keto reductase [Clostridia bacterium]
MEHIVTDGLKLGFGLMRLPRLGEGKSRDPIDVEQVKVMVDMFIAAGGKYFDTAFIYRGSEAAIKEALCDRYPRDSYYLATKLNAADFAAKSKEEAEAQLATSLERTGAGYLDYYLLHSLDHESIDNFDKYGIWDYVWEAKAKGLVKHAGFSFHADAELLDQILTKHPEAEFVQLQINYLDWEDPEIQSRACYEVCVKHDKPVIVMEPVKGGLLANMPEAATDIFHRADANASPASWAVRYAASLPNVEVVLSGMSSIAQMDDNLSYMKDFKPLSEEEQKVIADVMKALQEIDRIPCTNCHYCTPGCPMEIHIPEIFNVMNVYKVYGDLARARDDYTWRPGGPKASECIKCGQCEEACPQHLPVMDLLDEIVETLEKK